MASSSSNPRFADITSVEEFIERQENNNTEKKAEHNVALLRGPFTQAIFFSLRVRKTYSPPRVVSHKHGAHHL